MQYFEQKAVTRTFRTEHGEEVWEELGRIGEIRSSADEDEKEIYVGPLVAVALLLPAVVLASFLLSHASLLSAQQKSYVMWILAAWSVPVMVMARWFHSRAIRKMRMEAYNEAQNALDALLKQHPQLLKECEEASKSSDPVAPNMLLMLIESIRHRS